MASHDGKRRSHQRFLRNLPKQKPGKYLKVILSSVADPDLELGKWRERGRFSFAFSAGFSFLCDSFGFFFTQNKEEEGARVPWAPPLDPPAATDLVRVGLKHIWLHICYSV